MKANSGGTTTHELKNATTVKELVGLYSSLFAAVQNHVCTT